MVTVNSNLRLAIAVLFFALFSHLSAAVIESDICVYGGTSGGVIAAVQAARLGKSVVLVEFGRHVGGMSSGGLGHTDVGNAATIGGMSREFYRRVGKAYGRSEAFDFEPHVAEQVFQTMLTEAAVPVYFEQRLASVTKQGIHITELLMENGNIFRAKQFIDTTYEGDLLALAGVSFTYGREGTNVFNESLNGIRANTPSHQFAVAVDPYIVPGSPGSGLLPFVQAGNGGTPGSGDARLQAYNFRLCLTQVQSNKIAISPPPNYDAAQYELLGRYIAARVAAGQNLTLASFLSIGTVPNGKTDINNNGAFSTDYIGMNYTYATNTSYGQRAAMWQEHENYIRGFLTFLATDSRVPAVVRTNMQSWGLAKDEFQDSGGWPHQLYVREARRMVSDYVMVQSNCDLTLVATDSVGLASYNMDSHNCQRFVTASGSVTNEGDVQRAPAGPFAISYRAIVPRASECDNLLATFCLSGTHIAFSSCRMEPVFMMTSQSAATAAALAINDQVPIQSVPYPKLRLQLLADGQILQWGSSTPATNGIVVDSEQTSDVTVVGPWTKSTSTPGFNGTNYLHDGNTAKGTRSVRLTPSLPQAGSYTVYLRWTEDPNRATNVPVTLVYDGGTMNFTVNQRANGGAWVSLGAFPFAAGTSGNLLIETTGTSGFVIADAALWQPAVTQPLPTVELVGADTNAAEDGPNSARFTFVRSGSTASSLAVAYSVTGTASPGIDYLPPAGTIVIPAGQAAASLEIVPLPDALSEGDESISITVLTNAGYLPGTYTNAVATLHDGGFGVWSGTNFSSLELENTAISGPFADPDGDGVKNLLEFFLGSDPHSAGVPVGIKWVSTTNGAALHWQRQHAASSLYLRLETSTDLVNWLPAPFASQLPAVVTNGPFDMLGFSLGNPLTNAGQAFYRVAVSQDPLPLTTNTAQFFFSFDSQPDGLGTFTDTMTANTGFYGTSVVNRIASLVDGQDGGGATNFTDFNGISWLGSGSSGAPGHSLTFNPGSSGNQFSLTFSTIGLRHVRLRMDIRSATQGGNPPTAFGTFTYDAGAGPVTAPANPAFVADGTFRPWTVDLSSISALENRPSVTLRWTFKDLTSSPAESMRIDNLQVTADPLPLD